MTANGTPETINPTALAILAADVMATRVKTLIDQLAAGNWQPLIDLKQSLETYSEVRLGSTVKESVPPVPTCEHCRHAGRCNGIPEPDGECFEAITQRSRPT
jgi:hypothetical protein